MLHCTKVAEGRFVCSTLCPVTGTRNTFHGAFLFKERFSMPDTECPANFLQRSKIFLLKL
jgi:hypothetical protein